MNIYTITTDVDSLRCLERIAVEGDFRLKTFPDVERLVQELGSFPDGFLVIDSEHADDLTSQLRRVATSCQHVWPMVALTAAADVRGAVEAMRLGAFDVLERPVRAEHVRHACDLARAQLDEIGSAHSEKQDVLERYQQLTQREREVLHLVARGMTSRAIARHLQLRERTIEVYRSHVRRKMQVRTSADLARLVHQVLQLWAVTPADNGSDGTGAVDGVVARLRRGVTDAGAAGVMPPAGGQI